MTNSRKGFSIFIFAMATLLSFSSVSSLSIVPRVTRTNDAIILDFSDQEYSGPYHQGKNLNSELAYPGFIPVPQFNPYAVAQQQQPKFSMNGWSYFYGYPSLIAPSVAPSRRQFDEQEEFKKDFKDEIQVGKQLVQVAPAPAPVPAPAIPAIPAAVPAAPAPQCGLGQATYPARRSWASERIDAGPGAQAKKGAWPFTIALKKSTDAVGKFFCGGSLLSDSKVVLAAQCLEQMSVYEISTVTVLIGMYKSDQTDVQMTRRISKVIIHGKYNAVNYANDIAVIILDTPVVLSKTVAPVCLPPASTDPDQYVDKPAVILGWGANKADAVSTGDLREGVVAISAIADCRVDTTFGQFVSENSTCVTSANNNQFTCQQDIGGPVVINTAPATPGTRAIWTLVGINSYTKDCATNGLKTRVSAYKDWIDKAN